MGRSRLPAALLPPGLIIEHVQIDESGVGAVACSRESRSMCPDCGVHSADVILNILARRRDPGPPVTIMTPEALRLFAAINHLLVMSARELEGREASPTAGVIDSETRENDRKRRGLRLRCRQEDQGPQAAYSHRHARGCFCS
jgi:hypothetical protein